MPFPLPGALRLLPLAAIATALLAGPTPSWSQAARKLQPYPSHGIENEVFYFVMPDRFEDGNPANNAGDPRDRWSSGGHDPTHKGMYHGGDIAGLQRRLEYLQGMGITAIWMTPILKNKAMQGDSAGYHGYWTLDFTQLDPHLGSNDDMKAFIRAAHARGIKVFFDIITNHTADVIAYQECHNPDGSLRAGKTRCDYKTRAQVAAGDRYTPFVPAGQERIKVPAWLNDPRHYHNQGDSTWSGEDSIYGDFIGLDDVDTDSPEVVRGMVEIYKNLISDWKPDGFRIDTVKHVNTGFWQQFAPAILQHAREVVGIRHFTMFGEVYSGDPRLLSHYTTVGRIPSVLDFGFQAAAASVVATGSPAADLQQFFGFDDLYNDADSSANQLLTFLGNHDMGRFGKFLIDGGTVDDAALLARYRLANALMFTSRGAPVVYYGDEQGFTGDGGDQDAREDMFPSRVASYNDNRLIGTQASTAQSNFDTRHPLYRNIAELARLKRSHAELRSGIQMARANSDTSGKVLTFSRVDLARGSELLLAFNFSPTEARSVTLPAAAPHYRSVRGGAPAVRDGTLSLTVPAMDFVVLQAQGLATSPPATPAITGVRDGATVADLVEVGLDVPGLDRLALPQYQAVFEASVNGGAFQRLAVDNNAPYRLHWNTGALADGSRVTLRAALHNLADAPRRAQVSFTVDARSPLVNLHYDNPGRLPSALLYAPDGAVRVLADSDPADAAFSTRFDWGKAATRSLVFARLASQPGEASVVEQPIVLTREAVMALARTDAQGRFVADVHLGSDGALSATPRPGLPARAQLRVDTSGQPPLPAELNVRGGLNGWGATPMAYLGHGTYRASALVKAGDVEFKYADKNWSAVNIGQPFGETGLTGGPNPGNLLMHAEQTALHDFTVVVAQDAAGRQVLLHAIAPQSGPFGRPLFLHRSAGGAPAQALGWDGSAYRTELALQPGVHTLRLADAQGGGGVPLQVRSDLAGLQASTAPDGTLTLTVGQAGAVALSATPGATGQPWQLQIGASASAGAPFGDTVVYLRGELTGDVALAHAGSGRYEAVVVLDPAHKGWGDDGLTALKVADADWSRVNLGAADGSNIALGTPKALKQGSNTNLTLAAPQGAYLARLDAANPAAPTLTLAPLGPHYLIVHFGKADGDYAGWGLHAWGDIAAGQAPEWTRPLPFAGKTAFGRYAVVPMKADTALGMVAHKGDTKNTPADLGFTPGAQREVWIVGGDPQVYTSLAEAEKAKAARGK